MSNHWVEDWKEDCRATQGYIHELKARHDLALKNLAELAQGLGIKPSFDSNNWEDAMKKKAALNLLEIGKMPLRKKPYLRTY